MVIVPHPVDFCGISKTALPKDPPCQLPGKIKNVLQRKYYLENSKMPPECVESAPPGEVKHGVFVTDVY